MLAWIVTSSVLIIAMIVIRKIFLGKISLKLQYGLWILVLVRLLCPDKHSFKQTMKHKTDNYFPGISAMGLSARQRRVWIQSPVNQPER